MYRIRKAIQSDWIQIRGICSETGNAGSPIEQNRREFFEDYWVGVYESFFTDQAWVVEEMRTGKIMGYLLGCSDELWFRWVFGLYKFKIFINCLLGKYSFTTDVKNFLKKFFFIRTEIRDLFSTESWDQVIDIYPAHLHMNLLKESRNSGLGSTLIHKFKEALNDEQISGIHLVCGDAARSFYEKNGFTVLETNKAHLMISRQKKGSVLTKAALP